MTSFKNQMFNLTNDVYDAKKKLKHLQEKLDAKTSDFKKVQEEWSTVSTRYRCTKESIAKLTAELDTWKSKFNDAEFNFKKFDVSSEVVESIIEHQTKWASKHGEGFGYRSVPPPYNHNYVSSIETEESEECYLSNFIKKGSIWHR